MSQKATTKEELFLLKLHELASAKGNIHTPIDRYVVGRAVGQNDRGINVISRDLMQTNFIKKGAGEEVWLTPHGLWLVDTLKSDS